MVKKRKVSTSEKGSKEGQQNGNVAASSESLKYKISKEVGVPGIAVGESAARSKKAETGGTKAGKDGGDEPTAAPPPLRTSTRIPKRPRRDNTPPPSPPKKTAKADSKAVVSGTPEAKTRRQWELWSSVDKDIFFEALSEHGKDFDAIQSAIAQRHRKRGSQNLIRTKEQIRHFYYRTWHKISKFIENKSDVSKHAMELYGLINYGELRKRVGGLLTEKSGQRLDELVHKGGTVMKSKGKTYRIRTPVCRALKKLNNIEENKEEEQVVIPKVVILELKPASNGAWSTIQAISHNPRLRIHLPSNKRLSSVIEFLNNKWKSQRLRLKEALSATEKMSKELRLYPSSTCEIYPFDVQPIGAQPTLNLALEKFRDTKEKGDGNRSPAAKRIKRTTATEEPPVEDAACNADDGKNASAADNDKGMKSKVNEKPAEKNTSKADKSNKTVLTDKNLENKTGKPTPDLPTQSGSTSQSPDETQSADKDTGDDAEKTLKAREQEIKKERVAKIREGWNLKEAEGLTIAELYLLLGCPEKLSLEYDWVDLVKSQNVMQMNLALTNMLRRLVQLATTEFSDFSKNKPLMVGLEPSSPPKTCTCGAYSSGTPPGRGANKSPRVPGAANQAGKSPSTPKGSQRPGSATTPKTPGTKQGNTLQPIQKAPDQSESASLASSQVSASGSAGDGVFRVPNPVPVRGQPQVVKISPTSLAERQLLQQIEIHKQRDILMPKRQKKQVMRNIRRPLVVQRTLLPKMGVPTRTIMALNIGNQSQMAQTGTFMPVMPQQGLVRGNQNLLQVPQPQLPQTQQPQHTTINVSKDLNQAQPSTSQLSTTTASAFAVVSTSQTPTPLTQPVAQTTSAVQDTSKSSSNSLLSQAAAAAGITSGISDINEHVQSSDSNLSSLLDLSLTAPDNTNDSISSESSFISSIRNTTFSGLLDPPISGPVVVDVNEDSLLPPSASSPNKSFKLNSTLGPDSQWMGGEDFSLSQFLTDSPLKKSSIDPSLANECSRDSIRIDVDTALQSMMNENSMDYSTKFADLAAQIAASAPDVTLAPKK